MLTIRKSQKFYDPDNPDSEGDLSHDVDFGDDDFNNGYDPHNLGSMINDNNINDFLADNEKQDQPAPIVQEVINIQPEPEPEQQPETEIIVKERGIPSDARQVGYADPIDLAYDAIRKLEIISFDYYLLDNDYNRSHGISNSFAGHYYIEPYFTFFANTGNELLVGWHIKGQNGSIKAFGMTGIRNGVRYENANFDPTQAGSQQKTI